MIDRFILMLQFLTAIPIRKNVPVGQDDFGKGLMLAPLVGLVLGILLALAYSLLNFLFPTFVAAAFTIISYIVLTGGLHLDGLGDSADGLFSNRPRERMLEIMKDSRVGTNAVLALIMVLLLDTSMISSLGTIVSPMFIVLMPMTGRVGSLIAAGTSRYAGTSDGPGRWVVEGCKRREVLWGSSLYVILSAAVILVWTQVFGISGAFRWILLCSGFIAPVSAWALTKLFSRKLGGVTGDILGAVCELNQTVYLTVVLLILRFA